MSNQTKLSNDIIDCEIRFFLYTSGKQPLFLDGSVLVQCGCLPSDAAIAETNRKRTLMPFLYRPVPYVVLFSSVEGTQKMDVYGRDMKQQETARCLITGAKTRQTMNNESGDYSSAQCCAVQQEQHNTTTPPLKAEVS